MKYQYFDRDLSWLSFNYRILQEAANPEVPLYERIKFLAIYSSNLDEFFRVRVATIRSVVEIDKKKINKQFDKNPKKMLNKIFGEVNKQLNEFGTIWRGTLLPELREHKVILYQNQKINKSHLSHVTHYFKSRVLSYMQPVKLDPDHKVFLENRALYLLAALKKGDESSVYLLNVPTDNLPRFTALKPLRGYHYFISLEDIIRENLDFLFPGYEVLGCYSIKLNRDADLNIEDEFSGDLVEKISRQLAKRNLGVPSRFLYDRKMPQELLDQVAQVADLHKDDLVPGGRYHNFNDLFSLPNPASPELENKKLLPISKSHLEVDHSIFSTITKTDLVLHFPFHSYDYVLRFFNEAALNPDIAEIKATFYRVASDSFIINALISAARNGKKVTVFVEVKARFDEENNLKWARKMEDAGIKIIYSIPGMKVHAKVALIAGKKADGEVVHYGYFGTGNFNEKTAEIYADSAIFTTHEKINKDLEHVFDYLISKNKPPKLKKLLVSPFNLKDQLLAKIDREIDHAKAGRQGHVIIKINNLQERDMIDKLYKASEAGVKVELLVRSICCLAPGIEGLSENIIVKRIVDRFLEHARIYYFFNDGEEEIYAGSADWMDRNLNRRVEVVFPVIGEEAKHDFKKMIELQLQDNVKGMLLNSELENIFPKKRSKAVRSQIDFYEWLKQKEIETSKNSTVSE